MTWLRWLPWRFVISRVARSKGFIDPVWVLSKLHQFAQPSEVTEPVELMRAGVILQARGLINTRAIQHNLDWVWPYWVERQFNPLCDSFVPRAFSVTHVNLTHRNWTALGQPDCAQMPLVDPRGLVTPLFDGWSLDTWIIPAEGEPLLPSRSTDAEQAMAPGDDLAVTTQAQQDGLKLRSHADVAIRDGVPICRLAVEAQADRPAWLAVAVRPTNPEGVSFVHHIAAEPVNGGLTLHVNDESEVQLDPRPEQVSLSNYRRGDVFRYLPGGAVRDTVQCDVGMATGAALYPLAAGPAKVAVAVPLTGPHAHPEPGMPKRRRLRPEVTDSRGRWADALAETCTLEVPDERFNGLFRNALRNLVLFSPDEVYPGPYTSKRFWFRDAAFILNAMMTVGLTERTARVLAHYPQRQQPNGFFRSQEGEWDANGQAIYMLDRYRRLTGQPLDDAFVRAVRKGAHWIHRKRLADDGQAPHAGLLPAGFSAEHLGPNDYFYWDDFWSVAGLRAAARLFRESGDEAEGRWCQEEADSLSGAIDRSLERTAGERGRAGVPASPYRRMDAGAIGSLAASYPAQIWAPDDPRMVATAQFLLEHCTVHDGFFQDVIHSGINAYLTLHLAEVLLRQGDPRQERLVRALADLASPTGNWPEAIHPNTRGGCMGDGQHIWAAAEWVLMMRNWFVREEGETLVIGGGVPADWLAADKPLTFGTTATPHGPVAVEIRPGENTIEVSWSAAWRDGQPEIVVAVGGARRSVSADERSVSLGRDAVLA